MTLVYTIFLTEWDLKLNDGISIIYLMTVMKHFHFQVLIGNI